MKTTFISIALLVTCLVSAAPAPQAGDLTAHEWGTFTSVQGADGKLIPWHPLVTTELPNFVYDRRKPPADAQVQLTAGKEAFLALQRMETPVIYFYSSRPETVDVTVRFPKGIVTEWYPYAGGIGPSWVKSMTQAPDRYELKPGISESLIHWRNVQVAPPLAIDQAAAQVARDGSPSHYYAARETDSNLLRIQDPSQSSEQSEKFLFYRGVGWFETPLAVSLPSENDQVLQLANRGAEDISDLFILDLQKTGGIFRHTRNLGAGQQKQIQLRGNWSPTPILLNEVASQMRQALQEQGLYPREAAAMVATWRDSWLQEPGLRVLYLLPRSWTDKTLPLKMSPQPAELARVMVGRAEVIRPATQHDVLNQVVQFSNPDPQTKAKAVAAFRALDLGRFAEPAIRLVADHAQRKELSQAAWELLQASQPSPAKGKALAQN